ncbi:MAG: 8-oxo-dGTP diphosphatase MutT [Candidatus Omnitrophica bacterium]|nr:8-oxo-dGTP diphosphatase MutT [Candidatus Omnitrophota bacterium]
MDIISNLLKVTAAVIEKDGRLLIARRKKTDRLGGKWEFPGGKIRPGETPEQCLKRELKEEFGIEAEVGEFLCSSRFTYLCVPLELFVYKAQHICGDFVPTDHDEIRWVLPTELSAYDFAKADMMVVEKLKKDVYHV